MGEGQPHGRGTIPLERDNPMGEGQPHGRGTTPWERDNPMGEADQYTHTVHALLMFAVNCSKDL